MLRLRCVVEGHGEEQAVPVLVRRLVEHVRPGAQVDVRVAIRKPRSRLLKPGELERAVEAAARQAGVGGAVLVLLDGDGDCAAQLGPLLLERVQRQRGATPASVVIAVEEYEAWLVAAARSLRGVRHLSREMEPPAQPESLRGAKEWLSRHRPATLPYRESIDQAALTSVFSLSEALGCRSFRKLAGDLTRLLEGAASPPW